MVHGCTNEQLQEINRINRCHQGDNYDIVGVARNASQGIIKQKYRKLVKLVHPDKTRCPEAEEAFKKLDNAYRKINGTANNTNPRTDFEENLRRAYAHARSSTSSSSTPRGPESHFKWKWESAEVPKEEIHYLYHLKNYCYILLILGVAWMAWYILVPQKVYSLEHNPEYPVRRTTKNLGVPYYVKKKFYTSWPKILQVEKAAENEYVSKLSTELLYSLEKSSDYPIRRVTKNLEVPYYVKKNFVASGSTIQKVDKAVEDEVEVSCNEEKKTRDSLMSQARASGDRKLFHKAHYMEMPRCAKFETLDVH